jgi:DNA replication and repair protein RecF
VSLLELEADGLRCLQQVHLSLHPGLNLITGANGAGKTSLLEAIYLLGRGRSFRTRQTERLIARDRERLLVVGHTDHPLHGVVGLGQVKGEALEARVGGRPVQTLSDLSEALPVQVIDPGIHRLVEEGPVYRRRWLDWGVFHVEPSFGPAWQSYARALKQRNAALKAHTDPSPWEPELSRLGELITEARFRTLEAVQVGWADMLSALEAEPVTLGFHRGWPQGLTLAESLAQHRARDRERGTTLTGPHRYDVAVRMGARSAREVLSRGQQKLLGAAMALSMARTVGADQRRPPVLLLDDPAAELDALHTGALLREVRSWQGQLVVTALAEYPAALGPPDRAFHVEHGRVTTL